MLYRSRTIVSIAVFFEIYPAVTFELFIEVRYASQLRRRHDGRFDGRTGFLLGINLFAREVVTKRLPLEGGSVNLPFGHCLALMACSDESKLSIGRNVCFNELSRFPALVTLDTDITPRHIHDDILPW
jgi:hypothetical protein